MRVNISITEELNDQVTEHCKATGMKKSTIFQLAVAQYLETNRIATELFSKPEILEALQAIVREKKEISEDEN